MSLFFNAFQRLSQISSCIMALILLSQVNGIAQIDSLSNEPLLPLDTFDVCDGVKARTGFAVRYEQFAQVYFRTEIPSYSANFMITSSVNPNLSFTVDTLNYAENDNPELLLTVDQADLDNSFQLWAKNNCGDTLLLDEVSTSASNPSTVSVSHKLFFALERKSGDSSLYDVLEADSSLVFEEKLSFVQKYFFDDSLFISSSTSIGGVLDTLPVNHDRLLPCYCKQIKGRPTLEPFTWKLTEYFGPTSPPYERHHFPYVLMHNEEINHGDWKENQSNLHIGPSKYLNNSNEGSCTGSKYSILGTGEESSPPHVTSLLFHWSCTSGPLGEWCDDQNDDFCEKQVNFSVKYDTRLQASTKLKTTFLCGSNKGSRSRAEDYAALILKDAEGHFEVLEVGRAGVASEANKSYSEDWFLTILDFTVQVVRIAAGDQSGWIDLIEPTAELIEGMITNSYVEKDGANNMDLHFSLINNNTGTFTLKPNVITELMLISSGTTESAGHTGWKSNSRINSNYRLAAAVPEGVANAPHDYCCSDGFSTWSLASIIGAPVHYDALFNSVDAFFNTLNLPYTGNDLDYETSYFSCATSGSGSSSALTSSSEFNNRLNQKTIDYYQLFDINGRLIDETANYNMVNKNVIGIRKPENPGMYFIVAHLADGSFLTSKVFVSLTHSTNEIYVNFK